MSKIVYRLDLTPEEMDEIKEKLDKNLINKFKEIEITDKKIKSIQKASSVRIEKTREKFKKAYLQLKSKNIEPTQYNLRKFEKISYTTSKKYLLFIETAKKNIDAQLEEENKPLTKKTELNDDEKCIKDLEKFLLELRLQ